MNYIIYTKEDDVKAAQAVRDAKLGYPESLDSLRWVGGGRHCPKEFGRAMHYSPILKKSGSDEWALKDVVEQAPEVGTSVTDTLAGVWTVVSLDVVEAKI